MKIVRGVLMPSYEAMAASEAPDGAFAFEATDQGLFYSCPCGCGVDGYLPLRDRTADEGRPSWASNGNREAPTLSPSIRRTAACHWHGFLVDGVWQFCEDSGAGVCP